MVRQLRGADIWDVGAGAAAGGIGSAVVVLWGVLLSLFLVMAILFACAGGTSQDKASATNNDTYGGAGCAAGCGAACGG